MKYLTPYPEPFFNRQSELHALDRAWRHRSPGGQMALLYGRRRLGKTYLLQRFFAAPDSAAGGPKPHCYYLADQTTAAVQRAAFAEHLLDALPDPGVRPEEIAVSWNALLRHVTAHAPAEGRFGLILDEFPYLVEQTPELPSLLQAWWDREGVHSRLFIVLCGSQLSVMSAFGVLFGKI
jgi:AAA+ ATPase superfamily predicted ATPase